MKLPLKLNNNNDIYYNCTKPYSYNCFIYLIDGGRGIGKTTTFCIDGIKQSEKGNEFIYLRRYKPEIKKFVNKDTLGTILDGIVYKGDGSGGYTALYEDTTLGYLISLSTARSYKSVDFSKVTRIIFDEAIVKETPSYRYLEDEITTLLEFISSVVRTRTGVKIIILGNNEDIFNPYASYFNLPIYETTYVDKKRGIYCEHAKNSPKLLALEEKTELYKLINGTAYGEYHYNNKVLTENTYTLGEKPKDSKLLFRIVANNQTVNIYTYYINEEQKIYCERKNKIIEDNITYKLLIDGKPNYLDIESYRRKLKEFMYRKYFKNNIIYNDEKCGSIISWLIEEI